MNCPDCNTDKTSRIIKVVPRGLRVMRTRVCMECTASWMTVELLYDRLELLETFVAEQAKKEAASAGDRGRGQ